MVLVRNQLVDSFEKETNVELLTILVQILASQIICPQRRLFSVGQGPACQLRPTALGVGKYSRHSHI